jgi:FlaA1/EpsC-like NDP-sugar epimerase
MMGRIALVTGATGQIGREIALGVARFAAQQLEPESCNTYEDDAGLGTQRS